MKGKDDLAKHIPILLSVEQASGHLEMYPHLTTNHVGIITFINNELVRGLACSDYRLIVLLFILQTRHPE